MASYTALAPYVAQMDGTGGGFVQAIEHSTVTITGIEYVYGATASAGLLGSLKVVNEDLSGAGWASVRVDFSDASANTFVAELAAQLQAAQGGDVSDGSFTTDAIIEAPQGGVTMDVTLREEIRDEINAELAGNGVLAFLESDVVGDLTLVVDWSGAARNMANGLTADLRKLMFLQIPNRLTQVNQDGPTEAPHQRDLGDFLASGDRLGFVFNVDVSIAITQRPDVDAPDAGNEASATDLAANNLGLTPNGGANYIRGYKVGFLFTKA